MNVDYKFYTDTYGGRNVPESDWKGIELKAEQRLEHYTFGRMSGSWVDQPWEDRAKRAVCEMAEFIFTEEKRGNKTSENTDGYSVSYDTSKDADSRLYDIAYVYLGNTNLMDLGVDADDYECGYYNL